MKILVVSDSHGNFNNLHIVYKKESPDYIIFCGDGTNDIKDLASLYSDMKYTAVRGNCDYNDYTAEIYEEITFADYRFFITHGHYYSVKSGIGELLDIAKKLNKNTIIFGHTHIKYYNKINGINLFNPGSINNGNYGIINIACDKNITFELKIIEI